MTKAFRTTKKEFKAQIQEHIINALDEEYGETVQEQLSAVVEGFKDWYGKYERKMQPNLQKAFQHWLLGLPSQFNIEFEHYRISDTLKAWYENCGATYEERDGQTETDFYCYMVTREFAVLCKKHGVPTLVEACM